VKSERKNSFDHKWLKQYMKKMGKPDMEIVFIPVPKDGKAKYHNEKCRCGLNHNHDSRAEARYCDTLEFLRKAKQIKTFEVQKNYPLKVEGMTITNHRPDFLVTLNDGSIEVREFKSPTTMTRAWRIKYKMFLRNYPDIPYKIVGEKDCLR
jgi:hypothetical protein